MTSYMSILTCHFRLVSMSHHADVGPAPRVTRHGRDRLRGAGPSLRSRPPRRTTSASSARRSRRSIPTLFGACRASNSSPTSAPSRSARRASPRTSSSWGCCASSPRSARETGIRGSFPAIRPTRESSTSTRCACTTSPTACMSSTRPTDRSSGTVSSRSRTCRSSASSSSSSLSSRATTRRTFAGWRRTTCSPPRCSTASESSDGIDAAKLTFEQPDGQRVDIELTPVAASRYVSAFADPLFGHYPSILPGASQPLYLSGSARPLWARTLARGRAVYVGYNSVRSPTPAVLRKIERLVRGKGVRRVIVDLRLNGGGDNTTYGSLTTLFGSKAVNKRGKLRVLIGRATFSAAANFAAEIDRATRAVFVGEPTGGGVETYADTFPVLAPDGRVDRPDRSQVPRAQEGQERSPARGRARRSCRPHLEAVLRESRSRLERALEGL